MSFPVPFILLGFETYQFVERSLQSLVNAPESEGDKDGMGNETPSLRLLIYFLVTSFLVLLRLVDQSRVLSQLTNSCQEKEKRGFEDSIEVEIVVLRDPQRTTGRTSLVTYRFHHPLVRSKKRRQDRRRVIRQMTLSRREKCPLTGPTHIGLSGGDTSSLSTPNTPPG